MHSWVKILAFSSFRAIIQHSFKIKQNLFKHHMEKQRKSDHSIKNDQSNMPLIVQNRANLSGWLIKSLFIYWGLGSGA